MPTAGLITSIQKKDPTAVKQLFDRFYSKLAAISLRYCKSRLQAEEALNAAFGNLLNKLHNSRQAVIADPDLYIEKEFILGCIAFIKSIRSEYYVSSTVYAAASPTKSYDLFQNNDVINFNQVENDVLIMALQQLVPSQRLIFNMHVVDGFSVNEAASILESSEETVKSNLEKARFNLQKNIEKQLKTAKA